MEYLTAPPDTETLARLVRLLGLRPKEIVRTKEAEFKELGLDMEQDDVVLGAIAAHPRILERPIVVKGESAVMARPPENVLKLM